MSEKRHHGAHRSIAIRPAAFGASVLGVALLAAGLGLVVEHGTPARTQPRVGRSPAVTVNLGNQLPGQVLHRRVLVRNTGPVTMNFSKVITSCGCIRATVRPEVLPSGKTATLSLAIATRPWPGPELITATLFGTTGSTPIVRQYLVRYTVRRLMRIAGSKGTLGEPYYLDCGTISVGSNPKPFQVSVTRGTYPARWDAWRCSTGSRELAASIRKTGNGTWMLSLIPKGLAILGSQSYILRFSFYNKGRKLQYHYSQPVNFTVRGPVELEPGSVFFGAISYGTTVSKNLKLISYATGQMAKGRILSATSTDPRHATVSIGDGGKGLRVAFHAVGTHGQATGRFLVAAEYHEARYRFRIDYLADVFGRRVAK
ncbi:MAG: hypothetical protein ACYCUV_09410 [Phycisphaerae bacterium]